MTNSLLSVWKAKPVIGEGIVEQGSIGNHLLRILEPGDFDAMAPYLRRVTLELDDTLTDSGKQIESVWFPEAAVIGLVEVLESGQQLATALCGREGFIGWPLVMGNDRWPHDAIVRAQQGTAVEVKAADLLAVIDAHPPIRMVLLRYSMSLVTQMTRTIVSNLIHPVERRTARWLLLYHDRIDGDEIVITHEELGVMLGVRRSTITDALHQIEGAGIIKGHRGRVLVRNRKRLEEIAGETYGFAEREYSRLLA